MTEHLIRTMSGQITTRIREKILTGAYPPGSPLLQDVIAAEFGVSKIPVREALVQLRAEGLVDVFAHRGFQVRPLSAMEVDEVFRRRQPELHHRNQAVASGERAGVIAQRRKQFHRVGDRSRPVVTERTRDHRLLHLVLCGPYGARGRWGDALAGADCPATGGARKRKIRTKCGLKRTKCVSLHTQSNVSVPTVRNDGLSRRFEGA